MNKALLTATDVCFQLNISKPTLYDRIKRGKIEFVRFGRDYKFNPEYIEDLKEGVTWEKATDSKSKRGRPIGTCESQSTTKNTLNLVEQLKNRKLKKSVKNG